jgi:hypothetical protein
MKILDLFVCALIRAPPGKQKEFRNVYANLSPLKFSRVQNIGKIRGGYEIRTKEGIILALHEKGNFHIVTPKEEYSQEDFKNLDLTLGELTKYLQNSLNLDEITLDGDFRIVFRIPEQTGIIIQKLVQEEKIKKMQEKIKMNFVVGGIRYQVGKNGVSLIFDAGPKGELDVIAFLDFKENLTADFISNKLKKCQDLSKLVIGGMKGI